MIAPARVAGYKILRAVSSGRADLPAAIEQARSTLPDARDRALATEIATGAVRWQAALDHLITALARRPVGKLDPEVVDILRLSAYQLLHLTRVPASAVVDDAVDLARKSGKKSASGFVNAVLRALSRSKGKLPLPPRPGSPDDREAALSYLSVSLSHPRWLVERWLDRFGFDATEQWLQFNNIPAPLTLRANRLQLTAQAVHTRLEGLGVKVTPGRFAPDALIVEKGHHVGDLEGLPGDYIIQDEASQLVAMLAGPHPGARVLDTCASPGGKTTAIAATMAEGGLIVACDVRDRRMQLLRRTIEAAGAVRVRLVQADLLAPLPFTIRFDTVFVDVPCSGLGILRRDPDIRWRRLASDLPAFAAAQRRMVTLAAKAVAPGGRLIYATCSSEPEENEDIVSWFLDHSPQFRRVSASVANPALSDLLIDERGDLRTTPAAHQLESFYGAVLQRSDS
jgi:16S rRNA (cytosine967-C5)-methyltransferase